MRIWCLISILVVTYAEQAYAQKSGLVTAAEKGDFAAVLTYLEQGVSIESVNEKGKTALIAASQHGHTDIVKLLLDKGALVDAKTANGSTAFYYAAQNHHIEALRLLHAKGVDINSVNQNQFSPLSVAIVNRDEEMVRLLLDYGADPNLSPIGSPLLTEALARGTEEIFRDLVSKGADVNASREGYGETPLMIAVAMQRMEAVKLLLSRGADIRAKDADGKNVLHWFLCNTFSEGENVQLLELLINNGADYNSPARSLVGFKDNSTPLVCAVRRGYEESVNILLALQPDVNLQDKEGHSALYYAVESDNVSMVEGLLSHGANPALEAELEHRANSGDEIGKSLLAAMQPSLEAKAQRCPKYTESAKNTVKRHQPVAALDPLQSQDFPLAHVEALDSIPPVGDTFSLSPDGKWLVVRENNKKTSQEKSQRLVVYGIANRQAYFFSPQGDYRVAEDRWLLDSSLYLVDEFHMQRDQNQQIIDVSSGQPQLRTPEKAFPSSEKLFSGGDRCPWRNDKGQVVSYRPDRQDRRLIWSADGKVTYSLQAGGSDEYFLVTKRGSKTKNLIRHSTKGLRDRMLAEFEKLVTPDNRADFEKFKAEFKKFSPSELFASRFALSPNDRYLYYRISEAGGPMFFGLPDRSIVVDLQSIPVQVWYINEDPWGTPQWHPNGHDLYFIGKNITTPTDPSFPPMRQPTQWRLSVARFP